MKILLGHRPTELSDPRPQWTSVKPWHPALCAVIVGALAFVSWKAIFVLLGALQAALS